jgi:hypothetical protein
LKFNSKILSSTLNCKKKYNKKKISTHQISQTSNEKIGKKNNIVHQILRSNETKEHAQ